MLTPEGICSILPPSFFNWRGWQSARIKNVRYPVNIQALLSEKVSQALIAAGAPADCEPQVRQSAKVQFGDYQANGVMAVAKKLGMPPRQLAEQVLTHLDLTGIASKTEIAGPGFINIFLEPAFRQATLTQR